jgi:hypothetical protein
MMARLAGQRVFAFGLPLGLILGVLALCVTPQNADATVREWLMFKCGLDTQLLEPSPSARLMGMGGLALAVVDASSEINLRDYAGNVAGILDDSDGWVAETWLGNHLQTAERDAFSAERRFGHAGLHVVQRSEKRALGVEVDWTYLETRDVPGDWSRVRGPMISGIVNQRIGRFTLGVMLGSESENESRESSDFFNIRHEQNRFVGRVGLQAYAVGCVFGAEWQFKRGDVQGKSVDAARFHEDSYSWSQPDDRFCIAAVLPLRNSIEGALRVRIMDRQGSEQVDISWSGDSPENPSRENYFDSAITFREEDAALEIASRWRFHLKPGTILGAEVSYRDWDMLVTEGVNFKGSREAGRWKDEAFSAGVGLSHLMLHERLLAAVEVRARQGEWSAEDQLSSSAATSRALCLGLAAEYFVGEAIAIRAGVSGGTYDQDIDAPLTMRVCRTGSAGMSWLPRGGLVQIHGAIRYTRWEPSDAEAVDLETEDETSYTVSLRLLM